MRIPLQFLAFICLFSLTHNVWGAGGDDSIILLRGDGDNSGSVRPADADFIFAFLFQGGPTPACKDAADVNDDGRIDTSDVAYLLTYLYQGGSPPPAPGPASCGPDPTSDNLKCQQSQCS